MDTKSTVVTSLLGAVLGAGVGMAFKKSPMKYGLVGGAAAGLSSMFLGRMMDTRVSGEMVGAAHRNPALAWRGSSSAAYRPAGAAGYRQAVSAAYAGY